MTETTPASTRARLRGARTPLCGAAALLLASAVRPATAAAADSGAEAAALHDRWLSAWSASPLEVVPLVAVAVLYALRARRVDRRPPPWRMACFAVGLAIIALALFSPVDAVGEDGLLAAHMLQHTLLGAIAPLFLVLGLTGPVLRPLLARRGARRVMVLAHPWVAFSAWAADLAFWHIPPVFDAALANDSLHAVEHMSFVVFGLILWAPIVEPVRGPAWFTTRLKVAYMAGLWFAGLLFANVLWFSGTVIYTTYEQTAPSFGVSTLRDQGNAGTVMMVTHCLLAFGAAAILFFRQAEEEQLRQRLIDGGLDPARVDRAVKAGRVKELARRHGLPAKVRAGID